MGLYIVILVLRDQHRLSRTRLSSVSVTIFTFGLVFKPLYGQLLLILHYIGLLVVEQRYGNSAWVTDHLK